MAGSMPPERRARLAGSVSAIGALTVVVWVPLFIGPDPLTAALAFGLGTLVVFGSVEIAAGLGRIATATLERLEGE